MATGNDLIPSCSRQVDYVIQIPRFNEFSRNPFINFARSYHRVGLPANETIKQAANDWRQMTSDEKELFQRQAKAAPYRPRTRNRTFNRILKLLDDAEEDNSNSRSSTKLTKIARMIERWKIQSYRDAVIGCTLPPRAVRTKRKPDPHMYS